MTHQDHYTTLDIPRNASQEVIRHAYRKLARRYHPDISQDPQAEWRFKEIGQAYAVLRDPAQRAAYDKATLPRNRHDNALHIKKNLNKINAFRFFRPRKTYPLHSDLPPSGCDQYVKVRITVEDAFHGTCADISLPVLTTDEHGMPIITKRQIKINIPRGVYSGQVLCLPAQGHIGMGESKTGDLYVTILILSHHRYRVEGRDLYVDIPLSANVANAGTTLNIATPEGALQLVVPPASPFGRKLRLRGKGLPSEPPGDLYAIVTNADAPMHEIIAKKARLLLKGMLSFSSRTHTHTRN